MPWTERHAKSLEDTLNRMMAREECAPSSHLYKHDISPDPEPSSEEESETDSDGDISLCVPHYCMVYSQCDGS